MEWNDSAPGKQWIRTEFGWKPLSELKKGLGVALRQLSGESSANNPRSEGDAKVI